MPLKVIVLDASLLLLLIVGLTSRAYISKHKRLQRYEEADFDLLKALIGSAAKVVVTPNTLTEASNLAGQIGEPARTRIYQWFRRVLPAFEERYVESSRAADDQEFVHLGLADAAQLAVAGASHTLLTVDLDLYLAAVRRGHNAQNFNYYRGM